MAFRLTRAEENRRDYLRDQLIEAKGLLEEEVDAECRAIENAVEAINAAHTRYNEMVQEAHGFIEDIISERENEFDDKSERWQEGDRGQAARSWIDSLQESLDELCDLEPIVIELPDGADYPDHAAVMDDLPEEMEG